uniref:Uncharacterized protein n=1 Tax=Neobodo designis TaxID=312471 RepID=A0A7S1LVW7_NEODS|mmetsp:Transcript_29411/g.90872  ORF Transcript_29411/g.90872 Transcript_29411/m.90872 type:complete len:246 (+) Transcript_29411:41-778(+)
MQTSLDLTGVKHRTVHVANIQEGMEEDVAQLLAARAGPVERWARASLALQDASDMCTLTIVFESLDAVTTALQFNNLPFAGKRLLVWQGNKDKPRELLALEYKPSAEEQEDAAAAAEREERVKTILEQLRSDAGQRAQDARERDETDVSHAIMTEAERAAFLKLHAYRQAAALSILTEAHNDALEAQKREMEEEIADIQAFLDGKPRRRAGDDAPIDISGVQEIGRKRGVDPGAPVTAKPVRFDR